MKRKNIEKRKTMVNYRVRCESQYYNDSDNLDNGNDGYFNHQFVLLKKGDIGFREANDYSFESDIVDPKVIAVIYGCGNTFGYTSGIVEYFGPFTENEAIKLVALIVKNNLEEFRKCFLD